MCMFMVELEHAGFWLLILFNIVLVFCSAILMHQWALRDVRRALLEGPDRFTVDEFMKLSSGRFLSEPEDRSTEVGDNMF